MGGVLPANAAPNGLFGRPALDEAGDAQIVEQG